MLQHRAALYVIYTIYITDLIVLCICAVHENTQAIYHPMAWQQHTPKKTDPQSEQNENAKQCKNRCWCLGVVSLLLACTVNVAASGVFFTLFFNLLDQKQSRKAQGGQNTFLTFSGGQLNTQGVANILFLFSLFPKWDGYLWQVLLNGRRGQGVHPVILEAMEAEPSLLSIQTVRRTTRTLYIYIHICICIYIYIYALEFQARHRRPIKRN